MCVCTHIYIYIHITYFIVPILSHCFPHQMRHGFGNHRRHWPQDCPVARLGLSWKPHSLRCARRWGVPRLICDPYLHSVEKHWKARVCKGTRNIWSPLSALLDDVVVSFNGQLDNSWYFRILQVHCGSVRACGSLRGSMDSPTNHNNNIQCPLSNIPRILLRLVMRHRHVYRRGHLDHSNGHRLLCQSMKI